MQPRPTLKELGIEKTQSHRLQVVATLPDRTFEKHIADVKKSNKELTTAGVIKLGRQLQRAEQPEKQIPLPPGKFNVIYEDLQWRYHNTGFSHSAERHYSTMPLEEICALPIADMAAKNCLLFMWVTLPMLQLFYGRDQGLGV